MKIPLIPCPLPPILGEGVPPLPRNRGGARGEGGYGQVFPSKIYSTSGQSVGPFFIINVASSSFIVAV